VDHILAHYTLFKMHFNVSKLSVFCALVASALAAQGPEAPPRPTPSHSRAHGGGGSTSVPAPVTTPGPAPPAGGSGDAGQGGMTIDIVNSWSSDLHVSYGSNAGGPSAVGNPNPGPLGTSTRVVVPTSWAGRVYVGPGPTVDPMGTKVEGSTTGQPDIDVSYVDGYSVPMTCSVNNQAVAGCNIDLYANAKTLGLANGTSSTGCPGQQVGSVCYNPSNTVTGNGPAPPFFAPCVGAAYTFPNDNVANVGNLPGNHIVCCVGTSCPAPARQGHEPNKPSKRNAAAEERNVEEKPKAIDRKPGSGTLIARSEKFRRQFKGGRHAVVATE
jgi:hypothetical protein